MAVAFARGIDPQRAIAAMRWDVVNPWGRTLEKLSSHPLVARRIAALENSGLPGRPRVWDVLRAQGGASEAETWGIRQAYLRELAIAVAPWVILVALGLFGVGTGSAVSIGLGLAIAGVLFFVKQQLRYPTRFEQVDEITSLLERLDASPVAGIGVEIRGEVIGRGFPGYVLSPDLVVQDTSGFVPLLYRQPVPFLATLFGLFRAPAWMGQDVVARGWYRRMPGPVVELRQVTAADGSKRARSFQWVARYAASALVLFAGIIVMLVGFSR